MPPHTHHDDCYKKQNKTKQKDLPMSIGKEVEKLEPGRSWQECKAVENRVVGPKD